MTAAEVAAALRSRSRAAPRPVAKRIDGWIGLAAGVIVTGTLCAGAGAALWIKDPEAGTGPRVAAFAVNGQPFRVPAAWSRSGASATPRATDRVDLVVPWADLAADDTAATSAAARAPDLTLFVTAVTPDGGAVAPAERPARLYARFLSAAAATTEGGLIRREFRPGTPYEGEALYLAPPDGRAFAARCFAGAAAAEKALLAPCLAEMRLNRVDVQVRFAPALLPRWEAVVTALHRVVGAP